MTTLASFEKQVKSPQASIFWSVWALMLSCAIPLWVYGEMGTLAGWPYAPILWLLSVPLAVALGFSFAARVSA